MIKNIYKKIVEILTEVEVPNDYNEQIIEEIAVITQLQDNLIIY